MRSLALTRASIPASRLMSTVWHAIGTMVEVVRTPDSATPCRPSSDPAATAGAVPAKKRELWGVSALIDRGRRLQVEIPSPETRGWNVIVETDAKTGEVVSLRFLRCDHPDAGVRFTNPHGAPAPLTTRAIRALRLPKILSHAREQAKVRSLLPGGAHLRTGSVEERIALIAAHYVAACDRGSHRPNVDVAAHPKLRRLKLTPTKVRDAVREARRRELLTKAATTRPGGRLTPKAERLLHAKEKP